MRVLVLNAGSSSLKASLLDGAGLTTIARVQVDLGSDATVALDLSQAVGRVVGQLANGARPEAVGHRVVHGGMRFRAPVQIDDEVLHGIETLRGFAPLHNGIASEVIQAARVLLPGLPQVAVFDTAFHQTLPPRAYRYPVPDAWYADWQIRRFGFHGISVAWSVRRAGELLGRPPGDLNLVVAHLGNGCSVTAVAGGRSVSTSMGLTPLEGLMMGTRSGSIDPGILLYLVRTQRLDVAGLEDALDHHSGLVGVAGGNDVRELDRRAAVGDEDARLALQMFAARAAAGIAAAATALDRLDALVFTGGIGEHASSMRVAIVAALQVLGIAELEDRITTDDCVLSTPQASIAVLRVEAREDAMIAAEVEALLRQPV
jgi:acetate kinase